MNSTGKRVLIITPDRIGSSQAGIAIRHFNIAKALSKKGFEVTLASTDPHSSFAGDEFRFGIAKRSSIQELLRGQEACLVQGTVLRDLPAIKRTDIPIVVDLICPIFLENLERYRGRPDIHLRIESDLDLFREALQIGDFFICGSPRQRHFWMGMLAALGRVNGLTSKDDPSLVSLVGFVPFGSPEFRPRKTESVLKGAYSGIGEKDILFLWGGGIWDWTDPLTPIRAIGDVSRDHPEVKLFFTGLHHPQRSGHLTLAAKRARCLAETLGILDQQVFFYDGWIPYQDRHSFFMESDVGLSAHLHTLENIYAVRTRFWDYLGAGLPILVTTGDWVAECTERDGLGITVPPGDPEAMSEAMRRLTDRDLRQQCGRASRALGRKSGWDVTIEELADFLLDPVKSSDHRVASPYKRFGVPGQLRWQVSRVFASLLLDGWAHTAAKILGFPR